MKIDALEGVQLGGITQWIRIRGADASNPVLLLMQQGPELPIINDARRLEHFLGLEKASPLNVFFRQHIVHHRPQSPAQPRTNRRAESGFLPPHNFTRQ